MDWDDDDYELDDLDGSGGDGQVTGLMGGGGGR
jgi:hypothetical protein